VPCMDSDDYGDSEEQYSEDASMGSSGGVEDEDDDYGFETSDVGASKKVRFWAATGRCTAHFS